MNKINISHLSSIAIVPASALIINVFVLWASKNNAQYSGYLLYLQWTAFLGAIFGLNLIEIKSSHLARNVKLTPLLDFVLTFNTFFLFLALALYILGFFTQSMIIIGACTIAIHNSYTIASVFKGSLDDLLKQRLLRVAILISFLPLMLLFGTDDNILNIVYVMYPASFLIPIIFYINKLSYLRIIKSCWYTIIFIRKLKKLVVFRLFSYIVDMAHFPLILLAINKLSILRQDNYWAIFIYFFGFTLPVITVIKQYIGEKIRILLLQPSYKFDLLDVVQKILWFGTIFIFAGIAIYLFDIYFKFFNKLLISSVILIIIFAGVFILSLGSGITSLVLQHYSMHMQDFYINTVCFLLSVSFYFISSYFDFLIFDTIFILSISLGLKYFSHSYIVNRHLNV